MEKLTLKLALKDFRREEISFTEDEIKSFCDYIDDSCPNLLDYIDSDHGDDVIELKGYKQAYYENYQYKIYEDVDIFNEKIKILEIVVILNNEESLDMFDLNELISDLMSSISSIALSPEENDVCVQNVLNFLSRLVDFKTQKIF